MFSNMYIYFYRRKLKIIFKKKNHIFHVKIPFSSFPMHRVILDTGKAGSIITYFTASYFWRDNYPGQSFQFLVQKEVYIFCSCVGVDNAIVQNAIQGKTLLFKYFKIYIRIYTTECASFLEMCFWKMKLVFNTNKFTMQKSLILNGMFVINQQSFFVHRICELIKAR